MPRFQRMPMNPEMMMRARPPNNFGNQPQMGMPQAGHYVSRVPFPSQSPTGSVSLRSPSPMGPMTPLGNLGSPPNPVSFTIFYFSFNFSMFFMFFFFNLDDDVSKSDISCFFSHATAFRKWKYRKSNGRAPTKCGESLNTKKFRKQ
jgi:hypothetical protein